MRHARCAFGSRRPRPRELAFAVYAWLAAIVTALVAWGLVELCGSRRDPLATVRACGRVLARAVGVPVRVEGSVPDEGAGVIVANHTSFLDGLVLIMAIRRRATYVVGSVFQRQPAIGRFLTKIGCVFVGGGTPTEARSVIEALARRARGGELLVMFPEGGLAPTPELRRFRLGAFAVASSAGVPVIPMRITGSQDVLRPGTLLPQPGAIRVAIGTPIVPEFGTSSPALRDVAHRAIESLAAIEAGRSGGAEP